MEQCELSVGVFGEQIVCPAIERDGPRLTCGLINRPAMYCGTKEWSEPILSETFALLLGSGGGCDAGSDTDHDPIAQERMNAANEEAIQLASPMARALVATLLAPKQDAHPITSTQKGKS
jgi:hypothetical protein